jgi:ABC-type transporter Mla subunit MlaD
MNNRIIGYIVIITIILLLVLPAGFLIWQASTPKSIRKISFDDVQGLSFLAIQDPVRMLGVEVGVVTGIEFNAGSAIITIKTSTKIILHEGYSIFVNPKGVMGDQYLTIMPGNPLRPEVPSDHMLYGKASIGPDEAISYVNKLQETIHTLNVLILTLKQGTTAKKSLITQMWKVTNSIDTIARSLLSTFMEIDTVLQTNCTNATVSLDKARILVPVLTDSLPAVISHINNLLTSISILFTTTVTFLEQTDSVVSKINNPNLIIWKNYQTTIINKLSDLRYLINTIGSDTITLPVRLW